VRIDNLQQRNDISKRNGKDRKREREREDKKKKKRDKK
jgi:hypothetical protein